MKHSPVRFIHCADLHLDSRMEMHLSAPQAQTRRRELIHTFSRLADYGALHEVTAILICGDLFDSDSVSPYTVEAFLHCVRQYPQIDFLYLPGNHDAEGFQFPEDSENWPDNLWIFRNPSCSSHSHSHLIQEKHYGNIQITGLTRPSSHLQLIDPSLFHLVMIHGQICASGSFSDEDVAAGGIISYSLKELSGKNIDYLAAGHIHGYQRGEIDSRGQYCYCGCLEGRGFDECGEKGFVLLEVEGTPLSPDCGSKRCHFQFVPFACRYFYNLNVDITGFSDYSQVEDAVRALLSDMDSRHLIRIRLTGKVSPHCDLHPNWLQQKLESDFFFFQIEDHTRLACSVEDYRFDISLKGEFIRLVLSDSSLSDEDKRLIIEEGIRALSGEEIELFS